MRLMATCVPGMVEIAVTMDTDSTTTAVIIKPILMCFLDAHVSSFEVLGDGYAKDSFHVYWRGEILDDASPSSFKVTRDGYAEDAFNTYFHGRKVRR